METAERRLGRTAFGDDPAGYHAARPDYPARLFELVAGRCAIGPGMRAFEIGPGTGKATAPMLALGLGRVTAVEPDARLAAWLRRALPDPRLAVLEATFEAVALRQAGFDLGYAATAFHWLDMPSALAKVRRLLRPGGGWAMWWNIYMDPAQPDPFRDAVAPLLAGLRAEAPAFRDAPPDALPPALARTLDVADRVAELEAAGFGAVEAEALRWQARLDTAGLRALYGSFSVMRNVAPERAAACLDRVCEIAEAEFGGVVDRACTTMLYTARAPG